MIRAMFFADRPGKPACLKAGCPACPSAKNTVECSEEVLELDTKQFKQFANPFRKRKPWRLA